MVVRGNMKGMLDMSKNNYRKIIHRRICGLSNTIQMINDLNMWTKHHFKPSEVTNIIKERGRLIKIQAMLPI